MAAILPLQVSDLSADRTASLRVMGRSLQVDAYTAEVVRAMHARGVRPVLLKGPVLRRWLYAGEPQKRGYSDADLFVAPEHQTLAEATLEHLDFQSSETALLLQDLQNKAFRRERDGANVDLHGTFHGLQDLDRHHVWKLLSGHLETHELPGQTLVDAPDAPLRALLVVLHLGAAEGPTSKAWSDLQRALDQVDRSVWVAAAALARELGAEVEMALRLRRLPDGSALASELGLPEDGDSAYWIIGAVSQGEIPEAAVAIYRLARLRHSPAAAARYTVDKLFPPKEILARDFPGLVEQGTVGLLSAWVRWLASVASRLPAALRGYREFRGGR
jgi:hypothetical protein